MKYKDTKNTDRNGVNEQNTQTTYREKETSERVSSC